MAAAVGCWRTISGILEASSSPPGLKVEDEEGFQNVLGHGPEVALGEDREFVGGDHVLSSRIKVAWYITAVVALEGLQAHPTKGRFRNVRACEKCGLRINQSSLLTPPAVINHQAEQIANARRRAAEGSLAPYTIPLLANTQTRSSKNRVTWTLKFTLPVPADAGTTRRFSAVPRGYGPSGAHALEGAVRYAYPFDYQHEATTLLPNTDFLSLPDHVTLLGCTFQIPLEDGFSPAPLASMIARTLTFQATEILLCRPSLPATFVVNSRSTNLRPSLMPSKLKMTRNWMPLPLRAAK